jgi:hypothetical protein
MKRPVGVLIIGILGIIGAVLSILGGIAVMGVGGLATASGAGVVGGGTMAVGAILLILGILTLIFAIAFISLKRWAWWGYIILLGINVIWAIVGMAVNGLYTSIIISIIIDLLLMLYMNSNKVKTAFFG